MRVRTSGSELEINLDLVFCRIYFMRFIPRLVIFTKVSPLSSFIYKKIRMGGKSETQKIQILKNKKYRKNHEQVMAHEFSSSQSCGSVSSYYYDKFLWVTLMIYFYEKFPGSIKLQINSLNWYIKTTSRTLFIEKNEEFWYLWNQSKWIESTVLRIQSHRPNCNQKIDHRLENDAPQGIWYCQH